MIWRRHMADEKNVFGPWEFLRILGAANQEFLIRQLACGFNEKLDERFLAIGSVGSQVRKITAQNVNRRDAEMIGRINTAVERRGALCPELALQLVQRFAAGIAEDHVEIAQAIRPDI